MAIWLIWPACSTATRASWAEDLRDDLAKTLRLWALSRDQLNQRTRAIWAGATGRAPNRGRSRGLRFRHRRSGQPLRGAWALVLARGPGQSRRWFRPRAGSASSPLDVQNGPFGVIVGGSPSPGPRVLHPGFFWDLP
jgi:hypothetical protein